MKYFSFLGALLCATVMMWSCSERDAVSGGAADDVNGGGSTGVTADSVSVRLTFCPYDMSADVPTRAAVAVADVVNHLDVWFYDAGGEVAAVHQTSDMADFGSVAVTLDRRKAYTIYAVGHRAGGATLTDGVIAFQDDKVTQALFYAETFSPATTQSLSCVMSRMVAMFRFETTDAVPADVATMQFDLGLTPTRWDVSAGGTNVTQRTATFNGFSRRDDGSAVFSIFVIASAAQTLHNFTVSALDAGGAVVQRREFADVPLRNGYKTVYRGQFFTDAPAAAMFVVDDWVGETVVEF